MEHVVQLVHECCSDVVTEVKESGADLCELVLIAWALRIILPWGSGAVPKGAEGGAGEASCVVEAELVRDVCFYE